MTPEEALQKVPYLISPAHLAVADTKGKWKAPAHLQLINKELVKAWLTPNSRLAINIGFQFGKSLLGSIYFPAWVLLRWPETRIGLASYEETFAANFGGRVRDIVNNFGPALGVRLRDDTSAKGEWVIDKTGGGMVCKGRGGALVGRPVDLLILDDLIKNPLSVDTPVPTPSGWTVMGNIKVGDTVFSYDGTPTTVTCVSKRWTGKRNRVHFSDGSFVDAHPDHKWKAFDRAAHSVFTTENRIYGERWYCWANRGKSEAATVTTAEISNKLLNRKDQTNWIIPNALELQTPHKEFLVDPYVLGVWLGDGSKSSLTVTSHIDDSSHYISEFEKVGFYCRLRLTSKAARLASPDTRVIAFSVNKGRDPSSHIADSAMKRLKAIGVIENKHIPEEYLRASPYQRLRLLQGLMDTDGTVNTSQGMFCNKNRNLIDSVHELFVSLGAKATITEMTNDYGKYWLVQSSSIFCPFSLPRKVEKWKKIGGKPSIRRLNRTVYNVEEIDEDVEYVCIGVEAESHLYLAGKGMIPTHNSDEAQSPTILDSIWDWYCTVAYSRLGPTAPVIGIGTRWGPKDIFGRWNEEGKVGGDKFHVINLKAIAGEDDILGRKPGESLWPERIPLERLEKIQKTRPRWFKACWQGEPEETTGLHFQPRQWPTYTDVGDAWRYQGPLQWDTYRKVDSTILHSVDWAQAGRKHSNKTAITTAAFVEDGKVLILDVYNHNLRYEENAPVLADICKRYATFGGTRMYQIVASDDDMLSDAMVTECRRYGDIPEIRRMGIRSRGKILRAQAGIIRSQNGLFLLPNPQRPWFEMMADQLSAFTGEEGAEDDIADTFGILGRLADEFRPFDEHGEDDPILGVAGYESDIW